MKKVLSKKAIEKERYRLSELAEVVYQNCTRSLNVNIAFLKANLNEEEKQALLNNSLFIRRINLCLIDQQESLITDLLDLKSSQNETIKLQVIMKLGKMLYSSKFNESDEAEKSLPITPDRIVLMGSED